jgi:hypothetical protein
MMNDDYKIYVDAGRPATLNDGAGVLNRRRSPRSELARPSKITVL